MAKVHDFQIDWDMTFRRVLPETPGELLNVGQ